MKRWLLIFALVIIVWHHEGTLFGPLGDIGDSGTRWADWIDLLVPYLVVGAAAAVLLRCRPDRRTWTLFGIAALAYTQGHGIHLAANSVSNDVGGDVAHLWDEVVGHYIWYAGLSGIAAVLIRSVGPLGLGAVPLVASALLGVTWFTNSIEGGTPLFGIAVSIALVVVALRERVLPAVVTYALALVLIVGWGIWQQGFPQFSELGWV